MIGAEQVMAKIKKSLSEVQACDLGEISSKLRSYLTLANEDVDKAREIIHDFYNKSQAGSRKVKVGVN